MTLVHIFFVKSFIALFSQTTLFGEMNALVDVKVSVAQSVSAFDC